MNNRRRLTGVVASDKMTKTVVVEIRSTYKHPLYKKVVHATNRLKAHDELGAKVGDQVLIVESRPLSKDKRWVVQSILRRLGEDVDAVEIPVLGITETEPEAGEAEPAPAESASEEAGEAEAEEAEPSTPETGTEGEGE